MVTSAEKIAKRYGQGVSRRKVRIALQRFENFGFLVKQTSNRNTLITLCHWEAYQNQSVADVTQGVTQTSHGRQTDGKQASTNKKNKNEKKDKKRESAKRERFAVPTLEEVQSFIQQNQYIVNAIQSGTG
ncbi:MAG: hypothetical protein JW828_06395, partial [Sedimentisphaerales bacterium]|nr:hypothetical protein [Sedimentisphaerales bacterium]